MRRRAYLGAVGAMMAAVAGCQGVADGTGDEEAQEASHEAPEAVYVPEHATAMTMEGMSGDGGFRFSVMISSPEPFYVVDGSEVYVQPAQDDHDVHVMASIWDPETGMAIPETGLSVEILDADRETVTQEVIYAMLSQRMGFHYGGNFSLDGFGEYTARVSVGAVSIDRTRGFADSFGDPATVEIPLSYTEDKVAKFTESNPETALEPGALSPMSMGEMPTGRLPDPDAMLGRTAGSATFNDAVFHAGVVDGTELGGADPYFYVSPRTPHNGFPLPSMRMRATFRTGAGTETLGLTRTIDPELNYHYGRSLAAVDTTIENVDGIDVDVEIPSQVTRHAGYETSMLETGRVTLR